MQKIEEEGYMETYMRENELNIEKIIYDFKSYICRIIDNNSRGILNYEDKEEIISDTFLTVWHNKDKIDIKKPLKNYIAGITKNLIRNKIRKEKNNSNTFEILDTEIEGLDNIEIIYERNQMLDVIQQELSNLSEEEYKIFSKYYYMSKSISEIAKECGITNSNVKVKLYRIRRKLKMKLQNKGLMYRVLPIILLLIMITGGVFAKDIINFVKNMFVDTSKGVNEAIENGYIENIDMDYISSNGTEVKVDTILMDDYNLNILFDIKIQELDEQFFIKVINIPNLIITDENDNIIVAKFDSKDRYENFCIERGLEINYRNIAYGDGSEKAAITEQQGNSFKYSYETHSNEFPKSKKLYISFDRIILMNQLIGEIGSDDVKRKSITGNWNISVELPEEFYNRKTLVYTMKDCNKADLELIRATVSQTQTKIAIRTKWGEPVYNESDSEDIKGEKIKNWLDNKLPLNMANQMIKNEYVETSDGKKFYASMSSDGNGGYSQNADGTFTYNQTFELTCFEATDKIKVILPLGGELLKSNEDISEFIIELSRQ